MPRLMVVPFPARVVSVGFPGGPVEDGLGAGRSLKSGAEYTAASAAQTQGLRPQTTQPLP